MKARHIRHAELEPFGRRFDPEAYDLRALTGSDHGLATSVMHATIAPGHGPIRHRHPHAEIFVLHAGAGTFEVDGDTFDAVAGDVLIIPAGAWHGFMATGTEPLRNTAVHESPRLTTEWEDGTRQE
ncbi:MAG TPA: cupin domain-containing protein [Candidatus Limnocylindrales bacterium]